MTREEFLYNFVKAEQVVVHIKDDPTVKIIQALIGSLYDQQQMIEYLDNRIIDLERVVYAN